MTEVEPVERSLVGEMFVYGLSHPIKAIGNTLIAAYGVHLAREWGSHLVNGVAKQFEEKGEQHGENQVIEQTER